MSRRRLGRDAELILVAGDITTLAVDAIVNENGLNSIAFPAISCGVFGYPLKEAAMIAVSTCRDHHGALTEVWFALFGGEAMRAFEAAARCVDGSYS